MKTMTTPYKTLSAENKKIWNSMKYLLKSNPDKYFIKRIVYANYSFRKIISKDSGEGFNIKLTKRLDINYDYIHEIRIFEKIIVNASRFDNTQFKTEANRQILPSIVLGANEKFLGYEEV